MRSSASSTNLPVTVTHTVACRRRHLSRVVPASRTGTSGDTFAFTETVQRQRRRPSPARTSAPSTSSRTASRPRPSTRPSRSPSPHRTSRSRRPAPRQVTEGGTSRLHARRRRTSVRRRDRRRRHRSGARRHDVRLGERRLRPGCGIVTCTAGTLAPRRLTGPSRSPCSPSGNVDHNTATIAGSPARPEPGEQHGDGDDDDQPQPDLHRRDAPVSATSGLRTTSTWPAGSPASATGRRPGRDRDHWHQQDEPVTGRDGDGTPRPTPRSAPAARSRPRRAGRKRRRTRLRDRVPASDGLGGSCSGTLSVGVPARPGERLDAGRTPHRRRSTRRRRRTGAARGPPRPLRVPLGAAQPRASARAEPATRSSVRTTRRPAARAHRGRRRAAHPAARAAATCDVSAPSGRYERSITV